MKKRLILFSLAILFQICLNAAEKKWHRGLFRVNTTVSSGDESIETVTKKASDAGFDFIVFSDQFLVIAEYGLPPFRNLLKLTKERKSVVNYGIENYLKKIARAQKECPNIVLIPGVDIAPHYYWTGNYFKGNLGTNQWSEQLTVFGEEKPEFYKKLPVALNREWGFFFPDTLIALYPLLIILAGALVFLGKRKPYYADSQGNKYSSPARKLRAVAAFLLVLTGLALLINNAPFRKELGFSIYRNFGIAPFQKAIDYIKTNAPESGVIWSAPEARMNDKISGILLYTKPYLKDIEGTYGHNGLAGIYGDVSTAHKPGKTWDRLLLDYCSGKRKNKPVIVSESDYHGRKPITMFQTLIRVDKLNRKNVIKALKEGHSYAIAENIRNRKSICLDKAELSANGKKAEFGETLPLAGNSATLNISGKTANAKKGESIPGKITIALNGKIVLEKNIELSDFTLTEKIKLPENKNQKQYVRFYIESSKAGWLLANPIFLKPQK